jgi:hypothetical protein
MTQRNNITMTGVLAGAAAALVLVGGMRPARADGVRHLPPAEAIAGSDLVLSADLARASERTLVVRYRARGATAWIELPFARAGERKWEARIPAAAITAPGLEYFLVTTAAAPASAAAAPGAVDEVGSAAAPLEVAVSDSPRVLRRARDLARARGRAWRVRVAAERVDYGARSLEGGNDVADSYYRVDADVSYRLLAYPLEEIRFGYTRLEGEVPNAATDPPAACQANPDDDVCRFDAGYKVGGWFELGLAPAEGVRFDARGLFMANQEGFGVGGRAELRVGVADTNHLALGVDVQQKVGVSGFFRLGWLAWAPVSMATTVEVTDMPAPVRATGVRLVQDVYLPLDSGLRLGVRLGYAARDSVLGGATGGLSASFDF